jgi:hypothetical protein
MMTNKEITFSISLNEENYKDFENLINNKKNCFCMRYSVVSIKNNNLIVTNNAEEEYFGFYKTSFDFIALKPLFIRGIKEIKNTFEITKYKRDEYTCKLLKKISTNDFYNNKYIFIFYDNNGKIITQYDFLFLCGDTHYKYNKINLYLGRNCETIIKNMNEGKQVLRFKDGGEDLLQVLKLNTNIEKQSRTYASVVKNKQIDTYLFNEKNLKKFSFEKNAYLNMFFDEVIKYYNNYINKPIN